MCGAATKRVLFAEYLYSHQYLNKVTHVKDEDVDMVDFDRFNGSMKAARLFHQLFHRSLAFGAAILLAFNSI